MKFDLNSNDFLCSLNMSNATQEQKIQWLLKIIDNELDKPEEEQDTSLLTEAIDYFNELTQNNKTPHQYDTFYIVKD